MKPGYFSESVAQANGGGGGILGARWAAQAAGGKRETRSKRREANRRQKRTREARRFIGVRGPGWGERPLVRSFGRGSFVRRPFGRSKLAHAARFAGTTEATRWCRRRSARPRRCRDADARMRYPAGLCYTLRPADRRHARERTDHASPVPKHAPSSSRSRCKRSVPRQPYRAKAALPRSGAPNEPPFSPAARRQRPGQAA